MFCIFNIFTFDKKKVLESKRSKSRRSKSRRSRIKEIKDQGDQGSMFWSNPWLRLPNEKVGRIDWERQLERESCTCKRYNNYVNIHSMNYIIYHNALVT